MVAAVPTEPDNGRLGKRGDSCPDPGLSGNCPFSTLSNFQLGLEPRPSYRAHHGAVVPEGFAAPTVIWALTRSTLRPRSW